MNDIQKTVEGVMALRPSPPNTTSQRDAKKAETLKRLSDLEFQKEMESIMQGDLPNQSAYFFNNHDASKGGRKNLSFNPYRGEVK